MSSDLVMNPREHINQIRNDYNGCPKRAKDSLKNGAQNIAKGLYSKDIHFIFELIQNAEDNDYYDNTEASLTFRLLSIDPTQAPGAKGALMVENDELGFSDKNVDAICALGKSTKTKTEGYIGEKGIGFKSVFRVTSTPYIFSNGYRFCLPEYDEETGLGYIMPRWIEEIPQGIDRFKTTIVLPLDKADYDYEEIERLLGEIEMETILFLSKLKKININIDKGHELIISKDHSKGPLVQILVKGQGNDKAIKKKFLLYKKNFSKPTEINPEKRKGINEREISIAFPLTPGSNSEGKVFAYLPVRSDTGLPFLINADFLLTSSREDIMMDKQSVPWNQWLRDCVSKVFVEAFEQWLNIRKYRVQLYGYIPLETHNVFFSPVVESIHKKLNAREIVLTEPDGKKYKPEETRTVSKKFRTLLSSKNRYPKTLMETRLVLSALEGYKEQLRILGVKQLLTDEIKQCFKDKSWIGWQMKRHNDEWLLKCYRYILLLKLENLTSCPIVPIKVENHIQLSCDNEQPIYFEYDEQSKQILNEVPACIRVPLAFLDRKFYKKIKDDDNIKKWMKESLRIYPFSEKYYSVDVLTWFKENYKDISESDFVSATYFVSQLADTELDSKNIPILLADGKRMLLSDAHALPDVQSVVTPEALDPETGWQNIIVAPEDRQHLAILSDQYIIPNQESDLIEKLKKLWDKLNVTPFPMPFESCVYKWQEGITEYELTCCEDVEYNRNIHIYNYRPPTGLYNFKILEPSKCTKIAKSLIHWLSEQKDERWQKAYVVGYTYRAKNPTSTPYESEFFFFLKRNPWLPTTKGPVCPDQAFLPLSHIKEFLGDSVPYFEGKLPDNIIKLLGIRTEATAEELLSVLEQHSQNGSGTNDFVERVYIYLSAINSSSLNSMLPRLKQGKVIFVPGGNSNQWISAEDNVVWSDRSDVLGDDFVYLENIYPTLKEFFLQIIGINQDVEAEDFARLWLKIQAENTKDSQEIERILTTIYQKIRPICENNKNDPWWQKFFSKALIWTQGNTFEKPPVYVPDDGNLKRVFQGQNVCFAWRPEKDSFSDWEILYRALELPYLSESVNISLSTGIEYDIKDSVDYLTDSAKICIATWLWENCHKDYERIVDKHILASFLNIKEARTAELKVIYRLSEQEKVIECESFWDKAKNLLLLTNDSGTKTKNSIAWTLARGLMSHRAYKGMADYIELVLGGPNWEWRLKQKGWHAPSEIKEWIKNRTQEKPADETGHSDGDLEATQEKNQPDDLLKPIDDSTLPVALASHSQGHVSKGAVPTGNPITKPKKQPLPQIPAQDNFRTHSGNISDLSFEINKAFNRPGATVLKGRPEFDKGISANPEHRRQREAEEHEKRKGEEPDPTERRRKTERTILEGPDEQVRKILEEWYGGKCQICGHTFPERNGHPFFVASYIIPRKLARQCDTYANALCLCAEHYAKWQHGAVEADDDIVDQIEGLKLRSEGGDGNLQVKIKLCGDECSITFNEKHIIALQELRRIYQSESYDD